MNYNLLEKMKRLQTDYKKIVDLFGWITGYSKTILWSLANRFGDVCTWMLMALIVVSPRLNGLHIWVDDAGTKVQPLDVNLIDVSSLIC